MNKLRKVFTALNYDLYYSISNPKIWAAVVLILTMAFTGLSGYVFLLRDFDLPISAGAVCGLFSSSSITFSIFTALLLIFSEMPFNDPQQVFMITRCGKRAWCISQILYIIVVSVFIMLAILLFSMLLFTGRLSFDDSWGKVMHAVNDTEIVKKYQIRNSLSTYVMSLITPMKAIGYTVPLTLVTFISFGTMVFALNMYSRKVAGTIVGVVFITLNFTSVLFNEGWMPWITMLKWCSIEQINFTHSGTNPTPEHAYIMLSGIFVLSVAAALFGSRKKSDVL